MVFRPRGGAVRGADVLAIQYDDDGISIHCETSAAIGRVGYCKEYISAEGLTRKHSRVQLGEFLSVRFPCNGSLMEDNLRKFGSTLRVTFRASEREPTTRYIPRWLCAVRPSCLDWAHDQNLTCSGAQLAEM